MIVSGPITQTCWIVHDIEAAQGMLRDQYGAGAWTDLRDIHFPPQDCQYLGEPADFVAHVALSYIGDMQLELIQPVSGRSLYSDWLADKGPGLHHICFVPEDYQASLDAAAAAGLQIPMSGSMAGGLMDFAYIDGGAFGVPYVEIVKLSPDMIAFFEAVKATAAG